MSCRQTRVTSSSSSARRTSTGSCPASIACPLAAAASQAAETLFVLPMLDVQIASVSALALGVGKDDHRPYIAPMRKSSPDGVNPGPSPASAPLARLTSYSSPEAKVRDRRRQALAAAESCSSRRPVRGSSYLLLLTH